MKIELPPLKIWKADVSSISPPSEKIFLRLKTPEKNLEQKIIFHLGK